MGDYVGSLIGLSEGDTRSLECSSNGTDRGT